MNFFNQRIITRPISLEDAVKKAQEPKSLRSLDEILNDTAKIKTAAAQTTVKTAAKIESEQPTREVKPVVAAEKTPTVAVKIATEMPVEAPKPEVVASKKDEPAKPAVTASKTVKLAIKTELDFRNWEAQKVVDTWKNHGTVEACVKNVGDKANDASTYCKLLSVAASEADKVVKTAAAAKTKQAPVYKKIAKLTSKEQSFLREFFSKIYGKDYVEALLGNY